MVVEVLLGLKFDDVHDEVVRVKSVNCFMERKAEFLEFETVDCRQIVAPPGN